MKFPDGSFWERSKDSTDLNALSYAKNVFEILNQGESVEMNPDSAAAIELKGYKQGFAFKTSGTTGNPKSCIHSWTGLENAYQRLHKFLSISESYNSISCLPIHHIGGWMQLVRSWFSGGNVLFFHYKDFANAQNKNLINRRYVSLVPTQLYKLLKIETAVSNLRTCAGIFIGGAASSTYLLDKAHQENLPIYNCYGMTETAGMVSVLSPAEFDKGIRGVGRAMPDVYMKLNAHGQICIKCESIGTIIDEKIEITGGWLTTTDIGDGKNGYWKVLHRSDRIINTGGEKVIPELVEEKILEVPEIKDCKVFGVEDEKWGYKLVAQITPATANLSLLKNFLKSKLRSYEIPKEFIRVNEIQNSSRNWKNET